MSESIKRICHITTVHPVFDIRIFIKECSSLKNAGFDVCLIAPFESECNVDGINVFGIKRVNNRIIRIFIAPILAFRLALKVKAQIYHFHDPELIIIGLLLKVFGKKVIYDVHEDVSKTIMMKEWIVKPFRIIIARLFESFENFASKKFDFLVTATPYLRDRFLKFNQRTIDINNFPIGNEFRNTISWSEKKNEICYQGTISKERGIIEIIESLRFVDTKLNLAGDFESDRLKNEITSKSSWKKVKEYGLVDRKTVKRILIRSKIGLVTFHPVPNHINAQPNKIFEYMSAGIPVIGSNFTLWKNIIEERKCGICINPLNPQEIGNAIKFLLEHDDIAEEMGRNGKKLIEEKFNWKTEEKKLLNVYSKLNN